jgi:hypothetical protein
MQGFRFRERTIQLLRPEMNEKLHKGCNLEAFSWVL